MNAFEKICNLQSMTAEIRARMMGSLFQFEDSRDGRTDLALDIVAGYLQQASEDACAMAEAMCGRFTTLHEMALLTEQSERSFNEFMRAFALWKERLH
ncbi:MAG TPA: hypothetical protein PLR50_03020 [Candidatus Rifleibacterium sp.]|nr:hypothetical protein [Candidatus Rifleibacterium sp.]HPW57649.1 hypothetical protein [Candidatus Rifleibacterium sp.]HQB82441.1 hypothetical protein [Candidatus Rifleibacterium sp.]